MVYLTYKYEVEDFPNKRLVQIVQVDNQIWLVKKLEFSDVQFSVFDFESRKWQKVGEPINFGQIYKFSLSSFNKKMYMCKITRDGIQQVLEIDPVTQVWTKILNIPVHIAIIDDFIVFRNKIYYFLEHQLVDGVNRYQLLSVDWTTKKIKRYYGRNPCFSSLVIIDNKICCVLIYNGVQMMRILEVCDEDTRELYTIKLDDVMTTSNFHSLYTNQLHQFTTPYQYDEELSVDCIDLISQKYSGQYFQLPSFTVMIKVFEIENKFMLAIYNDPRHFMLTAEKTPDLRTRCLLVIRDTLKQQMKEGKSIENVKDYIENMETPMKIKNDIWDFAKFDLEYKLF